MKEITTITPDGVNYIDEEGNPQFIDFESCSQNYVKQMEKGRESSFTEEDRSFWQRGKFVGRRHTWSEPPNIAFYTEPRIYFEFPTRDDVWKVASLIKTAGWRTTDGE